MNKIIRNQGVFIREIEESGFVRGIGDPVYSFHREYRPWVKAAFWTVVGYYAWVYVPTAVWIVFFSR